MSEIRSLCVFCGSKVGNDPAHLAATLGLAAEMTERGVNLVYGGGGIGLMGALAESVIKGGGTVTGIIPEFLMKFEVGGHEGVDTIVVDSMHERKRRMFEMSDAVVVLPGGLGTLDETFEIITWKQLRQHSRPVVILNTAGYWDSFSNMVDSVIDGGFAHEAVRDLYTVVDTPEQVFQALAEAPEPDDVVLTDHL